MATGKQNVTIVANTGNPTTASGVTTSYYITARATELIPLTFLSAIAGRTGNLVSAIATAAVVSSTLGSCIHQPRARGRQRRSDKRFLRNLGGFNQLYRGPRHRVRNGKDHGNDSAAHQSRGHRRD
jgi:hypothetical protein